MKARYFVLLAGLMVVHVLWAVLAFGGIGPVLDKVYPSIAYDTSNRSIRQFNGRGGKGSSGVQG